VQHARRFCFAARLTSASKAFLRTTEARWRRDGTLERLFEVGAAAQARMARQYENHITELSMRPYRPDRPNKIGHKSKTMPRWSWVRGA
jgi:hypothetical protein